MASGVLSSSVSDRSLSSKGGPFMVGGPQLQHLVPYPDSSSSAFTSPSAYTPSSLTGTSPSSSSHAYSSLGEPGSVANVGRSSSAATYESTSQLTSSAAHQSDTSYDNSLPPNQPRNTPPVAYPSSSRTPSPVLSPRLRFEPTEPGGYHGDTTYSYNFLPPGDPQLFVAPSTHPLATGVAQPSQHSLSASSSSSADHGYAPPPSTSSLAQEYKLTSNTLGQCSHPIAAEGAHRNQLWGSSVGQEAEDAYGRGQMAFDRARPGDHARGFGPTDGWETTRNGHRGGPEDMHWDGSGGEDEYDDEGGEGGMERRGSTGGERGEVKTRRRTTRAQFQALESMFYQTSKPTQTDRKNLGEQLDMSPRAVQVWFQNRRAKAKKARQKAALENGGVDPGPAFAGPPIAFRDARYPPPANSGTVHPQQRPYFPSTGRPSSSQVVVRSLSDEGQNSSSSHSFSPDPMSPPKAERWENGHSSRQPSQHGALANGLPNHMLPPGFVPSHQPQPSSGGPSYLARPEEHGPRRNSASPVYPGGHPQGWAPEQPPHGLGFGPAHSPARRGSGVPAEPRMGRRPSANGTEGGFGPERTIKRRESNGSVGPGDPLGGGGRRGSLPGHQQPYPPHPHSHPHHPHSSPSRPARLIASNGGGPSPNPQHGYRAPSGGHRQQGSTVTQYLASSSSARRSSMPSMMHQSPQGGSRSSMGMYPPALPELSPIHDHDVFAGQQQGIPSAPPPESSQPMFNPSVVNGGFSVYNGSANSQQPQPIYGGYPPELQPPVARPRAATYHHLHQNHQPYDEPDPLSAPARGPPPAPQSAPPLAQYSFPAPIKLSTTPFIQPVPSNVHLRRASTTQEQQQSQPVFTSAPHAPSGSAYEFPPAPVGTLPDQSFSFGTYQQDARGQPEYLDSDGTERGSVLPIARHGSVAGESDNGWLGFPGAAAGGQNGDGSYLVGQEEQSIPAGFQPDSRRSSAPADLLQNFSSLQMMPPSQNGAPNGPRPPAQPLYAIHEASHSGSGSGSGGIMHVAQARQEMAMLDPYHQQQQQPHSVQMASGAQMQGQGMDSSFAFPSLPSRSASSSYSTTGPPTTHHTPQSTGNPNDRYASPNLVFDLEGPGYEDEVAAKLAQQAGGGYGFGYR